MNDEIEQHRHDQRKLDELLRYFIEVAEYESATRCLEYGADATAPGKNEDEPCALAYLLFRMCHTIPLPHAQAGQDGDTQLLKTMLQFGANPNSPHALVNGNPFTLIHASATITALQQIALMQLLLKHGTIIPEGNANLQKTATLPNNIQVYTSLNTRFPALLQARREMSHNHFREWISHTPPDVTTLTPDDLVTFANGGHLHALFQLPLWRGHTSHLQSLLKQSPAWMTQEATALLTTLQQPSTHISDWSAEIAARPSRSPA